MTCEYRMDIPTRENGQFAIVMELFNKLTERDIYTSDHSKRLVKLAKLTAIRLGCSAGEVQVVQWSALLHDVGKIGIPDTVLHNPGPLNPEEWDIMKRHPQIGADIIIKTINLSRVASLVLSHHEKWDGSGYPCGLSGEDIPLGSRILAVVDAYNAMRDGRVYRNPRSHSESVAELKRFAGTYYDPRVVEAFLSLFNK